MDAPVAAIPDEDVDQDQAGHNPPALRSASPAMRAASIRRLDQMEPVASYGLVWAGTPRVSRSEPLRTSEVGVQPFRITVRRA